MLLRNLVRVQGSGPRTSQFWVRVLGRVLSCRGLRVWSFEFSLASYRLRRKLCEALGSHVASDFGEFRSSRLFRRQGASFLLGDLQPYGAAELIDC